MKFQAPECKENAEARCSVHLLNFCQAHYADHSCFCGNNQLRIDISQELKCDQTFRLHRNVAQAKKQIVELGNNLVLTIKKCVQSLISSLDLQKIEVMRMIQMSKPESQVNQILEIILEGVSGDQNSFQALLELERKFGDFKTRFEFIAKKFEVVDVVVPQVQVSMVNPVFKSLEKLNLKEWIAWCKNQNLVLIPDSFIQEIKISKNTSFVFICNNQAVCKIN